MVLKPLSSSSLSSFFFSPPSHKIGFTTLPVQSCSSELIVQIILCNSSLSLDDYVIGAFTSILKRNIYFLSCSDTRMVTSKTIFIFSYCIFQKNEKTTSLQKVLLACFGSGLHLWPPVRLSPIFDCNFVGVNFQSHRYEKYKLHKCNFSFIKIYFCL